jgi:predicted amino acid racemase
MGLSLYAAPIPGKYKMSITSGAAQETRYPMLSVDLAKLHQNLKILAAAVHGAGCSLMIVTKVFCADPKIVELLLGCPDVDYLADSRIQNIKTYAARGKETVLLRLPQACEIPEVVGYADISLNSEIETIRLLQKEAEKQNKIHKIILMIDLGDLREGLFFTEEQTIFAVLDEIAELSHITLAGIGTNLTCYGAIIPKHDNLSLLTAFAGRIEARYKVKLAIVSGGNSSTYYLIEKGQLPKGVNNLRLGESFVLGNDTAYLSHIEGTHKDAVTLEAQIIELQTKPSMPIGEIGVDAFGKKPVYHDKGLMKRGILGIGIQDIDPAGITALDPRIDVLGASSDHLILDITKSEKAYKVGDTIRFTMNYSAFLRAFTSPYVSRRYIG